jgi:hypothetical protein
MLESDSLPSFFFSRIHFTLHYDIMHNISQPVWTSCSVVEWIEGHSFLDLKFNGFFLFPHTNKSQISKVQTFSQELTFDDTEHDHSKFNSQAK